MSDWVDYLADVIVWEQEKGLFLSKVLMKLFMSWRYDFFIQQASRRNLSMRHVYRCSPLASIISQLTNSSEIRYVHDFIAVNPRIDGPGMYVVYVCMLLFVMLCLKLYVMYVMYVCLFVCYACMFVILVCLLCLFVMYQLFS